MLGYAFMFKFFSSFFTSVAHQALRVQSNPIEQNILCKPAMTSHKVHIKGNAGSILKDVVPKDTTELS